MKYPLLLLLAGGSTLLTASCAGVSPEQRTASLRLDEAARQVQSALKTAMEQARITGLVHFAVLAAEAFVVYRDADANASLEPGKDPEVVRFQVGLPEKRIRIRAPEWLACDGAGTPAWSSPGPVPAISFLDERTGMNLKLSIDPGRLVVSGVRRSP